VKKTAVCEWSPNNRNIHQAEHSGVGDCGRSGERRIQRFAGRNEAEPRKSAGMTGYMELYSSCFHLYIGIIDKIGLLKTQE